MKGVRRNYLELERLFLKDPDSRKSFFRTSLKKKKCKKATPSVISLSGFHLTQKKFKKTFESCGIQLKIHRYTKMSFNFMILNMSRGKLKLIKKLPKTKRNN